jgi:chromate transporter
MFLGVKAVVVVVVAQALVRLARRAVRRVFHAGLAIAAFLAIALADVPFPAVVLTAALIGAAGARGSAAAPRAPASTATLSASFRTALGWLFIWWAPIAALWATGQTRLVEIGLFFSRLAVVSFGGAYAALTYMAQAVVADEAWLTSAQMIDGLGLAESTPGPLILVTEFVGYLAGHGVGGVALGFAGAAVAVWAVFVPCFLLVLTLAPHLDRLTAQPRLAAALDGVTAAVVGVIGALATFFTLHVVVPVWHAERAPDWTSAHPTAAGLIVVAAGLLMILRLPLPAALALMAGAGALIGTV